MRTTTEVQSIEEARISVRDHGDFAVTRIEGNGGNVNLFLPDHRQAKLVAAALHNDRAALQAMLAEDDDERPDEPSPEELRKMKALYEGEKAAGLHKSPEEYEADLRDAGRGHLLRR